MTLPNFLIIVASKAGTTSLYDYLRQHPSVFMPPHVKEPSFFTYEPDSPRKPPPVTTLEAYEALFSEAGAAIAIGEASPHYLIREKAPARIKKFLPDVKLIASIRHPVDRAFSLYQMNMRAGRYDKELQFLDALRDQHLLKTDYAECLGRYIDTFGREKLCVIVFEKLVADPKSTVKKVLRFLEVDEDYPIETQKVSNPGGLPRSPLLHRALSNPIVKSAARFFPQSVKERIKNMRSRNLEKQSLDPEERQEAFAYFADMIERTQARTGLDLSAWVADPSGPSKSSVERP